MELREPETTFRWYQHALLRRAIGGEEGCRKTARTMRERLRERSSRDSSRRLCGPACWFPTPQAFFAPEVLRGLPVHSFFWIPQDCVPFARYNPYCQIRGRDP
jgi:hypothetical protein